MQKNFEWPVLVLAVLVAAAARAQQTNPPATLPQLQQRLTTCISDPKYDAALWGVKVVSLDTGTTLFAYNPQKRFSPASNSKLYTVALALDRLGEDYRIKTSLYAETRPDPQGTLRGDLIVYGRGDPGINARLHGGDVFQALEPLVRALSAAGVKEIAGDLVADCSYFRGPEFGSGWDWEDLEYSYGAEISALTINDNTVQITAKPGPQPGAPCELAAASDAGLLVISNRTRTVEAAGRRAVHFFRPLDQNRVYATGTLPAGAVAFTDEVTVREPAGLFVALFKQALARHGIAVQGGVRVVTSLDRQGATLECERLIELGSMESLPMRQLAREVLKPSQNLYADLLLAQVGEHSRTPATDPETTSEQLGIRELNRFVEQAGIGQGQVLFEEGSGLSRNNLTTPNATVALLQYMSRHKCAEGFREGLPIAGVDGTLRNRMKATPAEGNVRAKTGTLRWANSLAGYVTTAAGEKLAFCLMLNRQNSRGAEARADLDKLAVLLAEFTGRSQGP